MNLSDRTPAIPALPNQGGLANVPGLRRLWLIETRHVLALTDPRTVPLGTTFGWMLPANGLQLAENALVVALAFPAGRGDYEQKQAETVHGPEYQHLISLAVPKDDPIRANMFRLMTGRRWIGVYQDANGLRRVVGTIRQPLRFSVQMRTTGYALAWVSRTAGPAPLINDPNLFDERAEFSYAFTYEFNS